ncbi:MAG TPA: sulfite exporter TauE/SafE family protein, partial [Flavobacteriales bacterium]|nr:sulfite exporter TauE/SafE family protein [Flavobacteriales bacterium]
MEVSYLLIPAVALAASLITLISGFGLGTLLLPVFALFFPLEVAILLTAVVHLLNNLFKLGLLWKDIHWRTVLRFGVPGILGAYLGARLMLSLGTRDALYQGVLHPVDPLDLVIAGLMLVFGLFEISKTLNKLSLPSNWMVPGGLISGFFGGLSGHQGALRSLFL